MKTINSLLLLFAVSILFAQDVQNLYDQAREALTAGNYELALDMVSSAKSDIEKDPQLDPNHLFTNRLLPKVEKDAHTMESLVQALQELYASGQNQLTFAELPAGSEAVRHYNEQAKQVSADLVSKRDEILNLSELAPEYRNALRKLPVYTQIERLASAGMMDKLSEKYEQMANVLVDSLAAVDRRLRQMEGKLAKMVKSVAVSKAQVEKMNQEVARLSQERLNYISSISEMLAGEPSSEQGKMPLTLDGNQVENVFANAIQSETKRLQELGPIDSTQYKELVRNYEKIVSYNHIFVKNKISADQSVLLAQYKAALDKVKVVTLKKVEYSGRLLLVGAILLLILVVIVAAASKKKSAHPPSVSNPIK